MRLTLLWVLFLWLTANSLQAQAPPPACPPGSTVTLASTCADACVICGSIDGLTGTNSLPDLGQAPPGFCAGQLHNTQWVGFVAGSANIVLEISVYNCSSIQEGLQIGIYNTTDCNGFQQVSNCEGQVDVNTSAVFSNTVPLTIGGIYFLVIDGAFGDVCDFSIDVLSGSTTPPSVANVVPQIQLSDNTPCPGQIITATVNPPVFGAGVYSWTVNGVPAAFDQESNLDIPITEGPVTICVTPSNPCSQGVPNCITINSMEPARIDENVTLCDGDSYTWPANNDLYSDAGVYSYEETTDEGCTQRYQLTVEVNNSTTGSIEGAICDDEIFWVGSEAITTPGFQIVTLEGANAQGCDSIVEVMLTVYETFFIAEDVQLCEGETYLVTDGMTNVTLSSTGVYDFQLVSENGCDSFVQVYLQVFPIPDEPTFLNELICPGETYEVGDQAFSSPGTYSVLVETPAGCDSLVVLTLGINDPTTNLGTIRICEGRSYRVGNVDYTMPGTYSVDLPSFVGCDSTVNFTLIVQSQITTNLDVVLCEGESYTYLGNTYTTTGSYPFNYVSSAGCDSIFTLNVQVNPELTTTLNETLCFGEFYTLGSTTYTASGTYTQTFNGSNGCDSIVTLNLTIPPDIVTNLSPVICEGETFTSGGQSFDDEGQYLVLLQAANGCDSTVNVNLTVVEPVLATVSETICAGESFTFNGNTYTTQGTYPATLTSVATGCDSIVTLQLTVVQPLVTNLDIEICTGQSYTVGGQTFDVAGSYTVDLTAVSTGCDSIVNLNLSIADLLVGTGSASICAGESYTVADSVYTEPGVYENPFVTADGCDSIFRLTLTVIQPLQTQLSAIICTGDTYTVGASVYSATGVYRDTLVALSTGCDSIVTLNLTVPPNPTTSIDASICQNGSYTVGSSVYSQTGIYVDTLLSFRGCDSIVTLDLTVTDFYETNLDITICEGESYTVGSSTYTTSGVYQDMFTAQLGCDSFVNLTLTVDPLLFTNLQQTICEGEIFTMGGVDYSTTGIYTATLSSAVTGCDSTITLDLNVIPTVITPIAASICEGETYTVGSSTYNAGGNYEDLLTSTATGCDSIVRLSLTVIQPLVTNLTESICEGGTYAVGSSTYSVSGSYTDLLTAISTDCDSIVNLTLTVIQPLVTNLDITICEGETYTVGSSTYSAAGTYTDQFTAISTGCDSIVNLILRITPTVTTNLNVEICEGDSYQVGSSTYTAAGTYTDLLSSAVTGCDSVVNLVLGINPVYETTLTEAICNDETFTVGNQSFNQNGTFTVNLSSVDGCDSVVILNLTVFPCDLSALSSTDGASCAGSADGSITFEMTVGTAPYSYSWQQLTGGTATGTGNIAANNQDIILNGLAAGNYRITVTDANNIMELINVTVTEPPGMSLAIAESAFNGGYQVSCPGAADGYLEAQVQGGTGPYTYSWSNGSTGVRASNLAVGDYTVTVTDAQGCTIEGGSSLKTSPTLSGVLESSDPACFGDAEGAIEVLSPTGGVAPYSYSINGGAFGDAPLFANLAVGNYQIAIRDANGCVWTQQTIINAPQQLIVELGDDIRMNLGDTIQLEAITTYPVETYQWSGGELLECPDLSADFNCANPELSPVESTVYNVLVTDANGCTSTDRVVVIVAKPRDVFIPNSFSPNEDGINDKLQIFVGNNVSSIKSFMVFNRWGESMYELFNFDPRDPTYGWDGTHRGELLNAGVYVYFAEVEFIDGKIVMFKGDVVIMR